MSGDQILYALHDNRDDLKKGGAFPIWGWDAKRYNEMGYGIFHTPNLFYGRRIKAQLQKLRYWIADIDDGSKELQLSNIKRLLLKPTLIVETNKGYHCYWKAENPTVNAYTEIEAGIIKKLNADKGCKDCTRLLRYPNYLHQKDPNSPFMVKIIEKNKETYSEQEMKYYFSLPKPEKIKYMPSFDGGDKDDFKNPDKWDKLFGLDRIGQGGRNNELTRITLWLRDIGFSGGEIENMVLAMNDRISPPLPRGEIKSILKGKI